ncbi:MAG: right-handed parallel beta-helix repeat-containing protein [Bacteroidales bacterium]|nr:right-handed parallel beta-helix repeat-containing protein [Bacteroidales bacterium]
MKNILILMIISLLTISCNENNNVYVSGIGLDTNDGTINKPFKTISVALEKMNPGDTCFIREGRYYENSIIPLKHGNEEAPIVIMAYPGEKVVLDGSVKIDNDWELHEGNIYKTKADEDMWQLFYDGRWMMMARWPNAFFDDGSIWDQKGTWVNGDPTMENGTYRINPAPGKNPSELDFDLQNALAVLNVGSFRTFSREITSHNKGNSEFRYEKFPRSSYRTKHHYAFIEGKLELLDAENEWFYDKEDKLLYAYFPGGGKPDKEVRAKTRTYALQFSESSFIEIRDIDFFSTTAKFDNCSNITLENCNFNYPTYSKRMLRVEELTPTTEFASNEKPDYGNNKIINCSFQNTDGTALIVDGDNNLLENCYFNMIDISASDIQNIGVSVRFSGKNNLIRHNTIEYCGASEILSPGIEAVVEYNRISNSGMLQSDGALIHCMKPEQPGVEIRYNWCHDSEKYGIRFDGKPASINGLVHHNVVWNVGGGYQLKGDAHFVYNNTGLDCKTKNDFIFLSDPQYGGHKSSSIKNNLGGKIAGHRDQSSDNFPTQGDYTNNWNGYDYEVSVKSILVDPDNLDFRPKERSSIVDAGIVLDNINENFVTDAPDIGAYEFGEENYWIPGRMLDKASNPIPRNNSIIKYGELELIWLKAYKALEHRIYFGESENAVKNADELSTEFLGKQNHNIINTGELTEGRYFWRVDELVGEKIIEGDVWSFNVIAD